VALCLRAGALRSRALDSLAENSFGIYLFHYPFVVWLQYALLGAAWFAIAKAMIVFAGAFAFAWVTAIAARIVPFGTLVVGTERRLLARAPASAGNPAFETSAQRQFQPPRIAGR
jgi:peptidoglycan/LPS O-acetylase OafA/YrhL